MLFAKAKYGRIIHSMDKIDKKDLKTVIANYGYNYDDFEIVERNNLTFHWIAYLSPGWDHEAPSEVTIKYKKTCKTKYYLAGNEILLEPSNPPRKWIREFAEDLKAKYFE